MPDPLDTQQVITAVDQALQEDLGSGDLTSESVLEASARARATLVAKAEGVIAGLDLFRCSFERLDPAVRVELHVADGERVSVGQRLATVEGAARAVLSAERTALNFLQRLSGTATATARLVERAAGRARILDTRKTTPGLRVFEKYAVRCGGGENHRFGLYDEVLIKDNHVDLSGQPMAELVRRSREHCGADVRIVVEARTESEARDVVAAGADVVMLDNFEGTALARLVPELRAFATGLGRPIEFEASGGVDLASIDGFAAAGVDRVSVGAITHSAPALDLSLVVERDA